MSAADDFEDLIGERPPLSDSHAKHVEREARKRRPQGDLDKKLEEQRQRTGTKSVSMRAEEIHAGVSVGWLAETFRLDPATVRKRIGGLAPVATSKQGHRYALPEAAARLVKPVVDLEKYLKTLSTKELPAHLQDSYWSAQLRRQKWELNAGRLWRTDDVLEVFTDTFQTIKATCQLWVDDLERTSGLSDKQRETLTMLVDQLQNEVRGKLIEQTKAKRTPSQITEAPEGESFVNDEDDLI